MGPCEMRMLFFEIFCIHKRRGKSGLDIQFFNHRYDFSVPLRLNSFMYEMVMLALKQTILLIILLYLRSNVRLWLLVE